MMGPWRRRTVLTARELKALGWWLFIGLLAVAAAEIGAYYWLAT